MSLWLNRSDVVTIIRVHGLIVNSSTEGHNTFACIVWHTNKHSESKLQAGPRQYNSKIYKQPSVQTTKYEVAVRMTTPNGPAVTRPNVIEPNEAIAPTNPRHVFDAVDFCPSLIRTVEDLITELPKMTTAILDSLGNHEYEHTYEECLRMELERAVLSVRTQAEIDLMYRGSVVGHRKADIVIDSLPQHKNRLFLNSRRLHLYPRSTQSTCIFI
jgi:hypothetical protein